MIGVTRFIATATICLLTACGPSRIVVHENPLDGQIGSIERGDSEITFFGSSESSDKHIISVVEMVDSDQEIRYAKLDEEGSLVEIFDDSGTRIKLDWNVVESVVNISVEYYVNNELTLDKTQIDLKDEFYARSVMTVSRGVKPVRIDTAVKACTVPPRLSDIRRVEIAADYGLGTQSWFPQRVRDDLYSTTVRLDADLLRENRRDELAVRETILDVARVICVAVSLFSPNQFDRLCAGLSFTNPNTARVCGLLLDPVQGVICISAEEFQVKIIRMIEQDLEKIDGSLRATPSAVYTAPNGKLQSAMGETRQYRPGPQSFDLEVALPCRAGTFVGSFGRSAPMPGRGPAENCEGKIAASGTIEVEYANTITTSGNGSYLHDFDCFGDDQSPEALALQDLLMPTADVAQVSSTGDLACPDTTFSGVAWKISSVPDGDVVTGKVIICGTNILHRPFVIPFKAVRVPE